MDLHVINEWMRASNPIWDSFYPCHTKTFLISCQISVTWLLKENSSIRTNGRHLFEKSRKRFFIFRWKEKTLCEEKFIAMTLKKLGERSNELRQTLCLARSIHCPSSIFIRFHAKFWWVERNRKVLQLFWQQIIVNRLQRRRIRWKRREIVLDNKRMRRNLR